MIYISLRALRLLFGHSVSSPKKLHCVLNNLMKQTFPTVVNDQLFTVSHYDLQLSDVVKRSVCRQHCLCMEQMAWWYNQIPSNHTSICIQPAEHEAKTEINKKAQLSLTNPRDAKAYQNCSNSTCLQRCRWQYCPIFMRLTAIASEIREIPRNSLKIQTYGAQGHPRSSILVSIESPYVTCY